MSLDDVTTTLHAQHAGRLFGLAYRMLGSVTEAEDAVQDAFVRWSSTDRSAVREPAAWLTTTLTRVCLDRLKAAQRQRETYVGPWLPEPLLTDDLDPADLAGTADSLTLAFLVVLESLSPLERIVFVLHDAFGYPHAQIAEMVGREPAAIRQLSRRARQHLGDRPRRAEVDRERQQAVTDAFLAACAGEDLAAMLRLLAPDVSFTGDGGGVVSAVPTPLHGAERVARMLLGFWRTGQRFGLASQVIDVNSGPGVWVRDRDGSTYAVLSFEVAGDRIVAIRGVRNPGKLATFGRHRAVRPS